MCGFFFFDEVLLPAKKKIEEREAEMPRMGRSTGAKLKMLGALAREPIKRHIPENRRSAPADVVQMLCAIPDVAWSVVSFGKRRGAARHHAVARMYISRVIKTVGVLAKYPTLVS